MKKFILIFVLLFTLLFSFAVPASAVVGDEHSEHFTAYSINSIFRGQGYIDSSADGYEYFTVWRFETLDYTFSFPSSYISFSFDIPDSSFSSFPDLFVVYVNNDGDIFYEALTYGSSFEFSSPSGYWISGFSIEMDSSDGILGSFTVDYIETDPTIFVPGEDVVPSDPKEDITNSVEDIKVVGDFLSSITSQLLSFCKDYWVLMVCVCLPLVFVVIMLCVRFLCLLSHVGRGIEGEKYKTKFEGILLSLRRKFDFFKNKKKCVLVRVDGAVYKKKIKKNYIRKKYNKKNRKNKSKKSGSSGKK